MWIPGDIDLTAAEAQSSFPETSLTTGRLIKISGVYYYYAGGWICIGADAGSTATSVPQETYLGNITVAGTIEADGDAVLQQNCRVDGQISTPVNAIGNSGTTKTVNWNDSNIQSLTLTANCTLTFSNPKTGGTYRLIVTQDSSPRTITWPAAVKWVGGAAPTLSAGSGAKDMMTFIYDGTSYYGVYNQAFA